MAQRSTAPRDPKTIHRTLHWFWWVTKKKPFATFMAVFTSVAYTALLNYANTYVMGLIVDRIVVLEDGTIVEDGTHAELSRAGGTYESLWDRQTGAFLEAE